MPDYSQLGKNQPPKPQPPKSRIEQPRRPVEKPGPVPAEKSAEDVRPKLTGDMPPVPAERTEPKPEIPAAVRRDQLREEVMRNKRSKAEKESEFVHNVEMLLGGPLYQWQKDILLEVRRASLEGRELRLTSEGIRTRRGF